MLSMRVDLRGLAEAEGPLDAVLAGIADELEPFLEEAADLVAREARREAPRGPQFVGSRVADRDRGPLRDAIKRGPVERRGDGLSITVGEDESTKTDWQGGTHYGMFVEHGTRPHTIEPKRPGGVLAFTTRGPAGGASRGGPPRARRGGRVVVKRVAHPGTRGTGFFAHAVRAAQPNIEARARLMLRRAVARFGRR